MARFEQMSSVSYTRALIFLQSTWDSFWLLHSDSLLVHCSSILQPPCYQLHYTIILFSHSVPTGKPTACDRNAYSECISKYATLHLFQSYFIELCFKSSLQGHPAFRLQSPDLSLNRRCPLASCHQEIELTEFHFVPIHQRNYEMSWGLTLISWETAAVPSVHAVCCHLLFTWGLLTWFW